MHWSWECTMDEAGRPQPVHGTNPRLPTPPIHTSHVHTVLRARCPTLPPVASPGPSPPVHLDWYAQLVADGPCPPPQGALAAEAALEGVEQLRQHGGGVAAPGVGGPGLGRVCVLRGKGGGKGLLDGWVGTHAGARCGEPGWRARAWRVVEVGAQEKREEVGHGCKALYSWVHRSRPHHFFMALAHNPLPL